MRRPKSPRRAGPAAGLAVLVLTAGACSRSVQLAPADLARLDAGPRLHVYYARPSDGPWVDCPGDEGARVWTTPVRWDAGAPRERRGVTHASLGGPAWAVPAAGDAWQEYQLQATRTLREHPPRDPARATAEAFLDGARRRGLATFASATEILERSAAPPPPAGAPMLLFEATRWVLVGCWTEYQPWFDARATLSDGSGRIVWRQTCPGLYPPLPGARASREELEANGGALYAQKIEERARSCADHLLARVSAAASRAAGP